MKATHIANPVEVTARQIVEVEVPPGLAGGELFAIYRLDDGTAFEADAGMLARFPDPQPGDYVVTQQDGYTYLNPRDVFERKYRPASEAPGSLSDEAIARICHEANRLYCMGLGDTSHLPWNQAPEWQKKSAIAGVRFLRENPNAGPSDSHNNWYRQKVADGWVFGLLKDEEAKTHPCMAPLENLPAEQQFKDHLFHGIATAALGR